MDGPAPDAGQRELTQEELRRAARAGEMLGMTRPGAPRGVSAPVGLPRVASLVGRDAALEAALTALAGAGRPIALALIGPPGVGKSALAAEIVAQAAGRALFPGGAVWVACEGLSGDPGLADALRQVTRALGGELSPDGPRALLALDHLEPALDVAALLDALAPENHALLLTARHPLQDARVRDTLLAPLDPGAATVLYRQTLHQTDLARPDAGDEPLIAGAAQALGGSPLAIGLSAALVGATSSLPNMTDDGQEQDAAERLRRTWVALPEGARRAFAALALVEGATFPRGVALALSGVALRGVDGAALALPADEGNVSVGEEEADELWRMAAAQTVDALIGLRLVESLAVGRLSLHDLIRRFAAQRCAELPDAARESLGAAMAGWWLAFARAHEDTDREEALAAEAPGLMGALVWARMAARHLTVLELADVISLTWRAHGRAADLGHALAWSVDAARALDDAALLRHTLHDLALHAAGVGRLAEARARHTEALRLAVALDDARAEAQERQALAALGAGTGPPAHEEA